MTTSNAREQELAGWEKSLLFFFFLVCAVIAAIFLAPQAWQRYARNRTAAVRAVVWNNSEQTIYMNDGTVWAVRLNRGYMPAPKPIVGDTARYEYVGHLDDAPSELCSIHDVTIGADYLGERISSPFTRSSCPER